MDTLLDRLYRLHPEAKYIHEDERPGVVFYPVHGTSLTYVLYKDTGRIERHDVTLPVHCRAVTVEVP